MELAKSQLGGNSCFTIIILNCAYELSLLREKFNRLTDSLYHWQAELDIKRDMQWRIWRESITLSLTHQVPLTRAWQRLPAPLLMYFNPRPTSNLKPDELKQGKSAGRVGRWRGN